MVIAHAAVGFKCYFHFWIIKNMDLETVCHFGTPNQRKSQTNLQARSQETPKMHRKIIKVDTWPSSCLWAVSVDPWLTKMVTQDINMEPQGHQNYSFRYKK